MTGRRGPSLKGWLRLSNYNFMPTSLSVGEAPRWRGDYDSIANILADYLASRRGPSLKGWLRHSKAFVQSDTKLVGEAPRWRGDYDIRTLYLSLHPSMSERPLAEGVTTTKKRGQAHLCMYLPSSFMVNLATKKVTRWILFWSQRALTLGFCSSAERALVSPQ